MELLTGTGDHGGDDGGGRIVTPMTSATCPRTDVLGRGPIATVRLPVHPLYLNRVELVGRYGSHALRVEQSDGQLRLLPVAWTDLVPRPAALALRGRRVRLAPEALRELGAWVAARIASHGLPEKLDPNAGDARELTDLIWKDRPSSGDFTGPVLETGW